MNRENRNDVVLSIVIPCYNSELYIENCINSILTQDYSNFEVLIVDDGSKDKTSTIVKRIIDENKNKSLRYYFQHNNGQSSARNFGILHSKGKYIAFLDSDDYMAPNSLQVRMDTLKSKPSIDILHSDAFLNIDGNILEQTYKELYGAKIETKIIKNLLKQNFLINSTVIVKKEVLLEVGMFDPLIFSAEDYDLWIRIALKNKQFDYVDIPTIVHTIRKSSLSKLMTLQGYLRNILKVYDKILKNEDLRFGNKRILKCTIRKLNSMIEAENVKEFILTKNSKEANLFIIKQILKLKNIRSNLKHLFKDNMESQT